MEDRTKVERPRRFMPRRRSAKLGVALVVALIVAVPLAWANHTFIDVPAASPHHADISTIARIGITSGCNPPTNNMYCPDQFVRRDQMGSFLARTLRALTPVFVRSDTGSGALDIDASPVVCQTANHVPTVAEHARIDSWFSGNPASSALMAFFVRNVYSTDNGTTWNNLDSNSVSRAGSTVAGSWTHATNAATLNLVAGTTYRFGAQIGRVIGGGTVDPGDYRCEVLAEITYSDAGASTLGAGSTVSGERQDR